MIKDNCYKKYLVFGIIILFIGAVVAPNISGYDKNTGINFLREVPASLPLNDDYVNIYLKFDEGSGTNAGDSSGHDYDGTIYGATWVNGYYGKALDFDGVDDYLNLSSYAKYYLGYNKTDDMIVSFYFKSTSTSRGIIYSMCRGDKYGYNPGFHVGLAANGTIEVQAWRLNCGILTWSENSFNDGEWHYVEVYYNGISSNPTAYIFVNGTFENSYTKFICDFYSDNFKYAQIGMNSADYDDFFDGVLDEFKIIKYPGGNRQVPPVIDGPTYGDPGVYYKYYFTTNDPEEDDISIQIDWGNGDISEWSDQVASGEVINISYKWYKDGIYCVKARSRDFWHESLWSNCYEVKIGNQPPDPPIIDGPRYGDPYVEYTYTFRSKDFENDKIKYKVDWDDGSTQETDYYPSNTTVQLQHSWDTKADYYISAQAIDELEKAGKSSEFHIRIGDEPPRKPDIDGPISGKPNVEIDFIFTADDPENDPVWFNIKWGDGQEIPEIGPFDSDEPVTIAHLWEKSGNFKIRARARDQFGYWGNEESFNINIPRNRAYNYNLIELLLERYPNVFPILRYLLAL